MDPERGFSPREWVSCANTGPAASSKAKIAAASMNQPYTTRRARVGSGQDGAVPPATGRGKLIVQSAQRLIPNYLATSSSTPTNIRGTLVQPVNKLAAPFETPQRGPALNQMQPQVILSQFGAPIRKPREVPPINPRGSPVWSGGSEKWKPRSAVYVRGVTKCVPLNVE